MLNKKEAHEVFGKVWKEFNKVRKNNTDDGAWALSILYGNNCVASRTHIVVNLTFYGLR